MNSRAWIGAGVAVVVAIGCSTSDSNSLGGGGGGSSTDACPTGTDVASGLTYVQAEQCQRCHGQDMSGSLTPVTVPNEPARDYLYPPNLTPDPTTGVGNWRDSDLAEAITEGVDNQGERLCPEMQHYPGMCANEVTGIISYLRSIPAVVKTVPRSICPPLKPNPDGAI